jgi:hypothetical protein
MLDPALAQEFLAQRRFAVVGASDDPKSFGRTVLRELRDHGYEVVAVNPHVRTVLDEPCYPSLAAVPGALDGAIVMLHRDRSARIVRECLDAGVPRVWLFQGVGGAGAVSDEALALCAEHGLPVVAGACPLMFLEPVGLVHRIHRRVRQLNGSLARST